MENPNWSNYGQWANSIHPNSRTPKETGNTKGKRKEAKKKLSTSKDMKYSSLKQYMRDILKHSLITSIPEITVSQSYAKKIIKIFVLIICLIGFTYQTMDFLWLYLSYPTVVNVLISNPFEVVQPAITFCNRNRQRRTVICSGEYNECSFMPKDRYCDTYPRSCPTFRQPFTGIPFVNSYIQNEWWWEDAVEEAHNESMVNYCKIRSEGAQRPCMKPYRSVPVVTLSGEPNICYTIESVWGKPNEELELYPNTFFIELEINTQPEEYIIYTEPVLIKIAVHDRRKLVNPYTEGYSLKGGVQYEATVSMTEKKLLPAPYDTNCTDYVKQWKQNNGSGPVNDLMCIEYCKLQTVKKQGNCIDKNVAYPNMEPICPRLNVTTTSEIIRNCSNVCGAPCEDYTYEVRYEEINNYDHVCKDEWCRIEKIKLSMYFKQFRVTKFQYQPKFESVEMFSYIGGYMGMWLGLSLVSLFDFFETISYLLYFPIGRLKWNRMRKKTKSLSRPRGNNFYYNSQMY